MWPLRTSGCFLDYRRLNLALSYKFSGLNVSYKGMISDFIYIIVFRVLRVLGGAVSSCFLFYFFLNIGLYSSGVYMLVESIVFAYFSNSIVRY